MRTNAIIKLIWNRKKKKLIAGEPAPIQVEIFFTNGKKMYIGTGIVVPSNQWDTQTRMIVNSPIAGKLNKLLQDLMSKIRNREATLNERGIVLDSNHVNAVLSKPSDSNFLTFMQAEINKRTDIAPGTRYLHERVKKNLEACKIMNFADLTYENMQRFNEYLHGFIIAQTSIHKQFQVVKTYLHKAQAMELTTVDPFVKYKIKRGSHSIRVRLDDAEIDLLKNVELNKELDFIRNLYLFQTFTGLSFKDLRSLTRQSIVKEKDGIWLEGLRKKTGEYYSVFLLPEAVTILEKYDDPEQKPLFQAPEQSLYNRKLKIVAGIAKINKNLTSHTARHTAASWMLNHGVRLEVVQAILGHTQIQTTQIYAKLIKQTIREEMEKTIKK